MKRLQITIDDDTANLLDTLATPRAGNRSFVIREAVRRMAEQEGFEDYLDWLEQQPTVRASLDRAREDEKKMRTVTHEDALQRLAAKKK